MTGVAIEQLGISVQGQVIRRYDKETGRTTLSVTEEQAWELYNALGPVVRFFQQQQQEEELDGGED
jgi:hypothetical protein